MKWIKTFKIFESIKQGIDWNSQQFLDNVEERLIDFKHIGFHVVVSQSSSTILDFDKKMQDVRYTDEPRENKFHIKSTEIDRYNSGISKTSLTIGLVPSPLSIGSGPHNFNIDELEIIYNDFASYLRDVFGLVPNYINIVRLTIKNTAGGSSIGQFLYFKDFQSIREFLVAKSSIDLDTLQATGFNLGFYK